MYIFLVIFIGECEATMKHYGIVYIYLHIYIYIHIQGADYVWEHNLNDYYFMSILIYVMS